MVARAAIVRPALGVFQRSDYESKGKDIVYRSLFCEKQMSKKILAGIEHV